MDKEKYREIKKLMLIMAVVILLIVYSGNIFKAAGNIFEAFQPFAIGIIIAFIINIPMELIEKKLLKKWKGKVADKLKRAVSLLLALLVIIAVVSLVVFTIVPQLASTVADIGIRIPEFTDGFFILLNDVTKDVPEINKYVMELSKSEFEWQKAFQGIWSFFQSGGAAGQLVSSTVNVASSIAGFVVKTVVAFVFSIYVLISKEKLLRQTKLICSTYMPEKVFNYSMHVVEVVSDNFRKFIMGQCLEACILGTMFGITMKIIGIPYALLVAVLIGFTALIPIAGAFIGCFIGAFLILMVSPIKMIQFLILFLVLQQLEDKLIYPRVVGNSVGLPAMWVFIAVTVGGSLMGVLGMLLFIPLTSTVYMLVREDVQRRNKIKNKKKKVKKE